MKASPVIPVQLLLVAAQETGQRVVHEMERAGLRLQCECVETPGRLFRALRHGTWDIIVCVPDLSQLKLRIALALILDSGLALPVVVVGEGSDTDVEGGEERVLAEKGVFICSRADVSRAVRQVMREIALRREFQQLVDMRECYRELLDHLPDSAYVHDAHGRFTYVNRAAERLCGYRPGELIGRNFAELVAPEYLEIAQRGRGSDLAPEEPTIYEIEIIAKDGARVRVEVSSWLLLREGVATGVYGFGRAPREHAAAAIDEGAVRSPERRAVDAQLCHAIDAIDCQSLRLAEMTGGNFSPSAQACVDALRADIWRLKTLATETLI